MSISIGLDHRGNFYAGPEETAQCFDVVSQSGDFNFYPATIRQIHVRIINQTSKTMWLPPEKNGYSQ